MVRQAGELCGLSEGASRREAIAAVAVEAVLGHALREVLRRAQRKVRRREQALKVVYPVAEDARV